MNTRTTLAAALAGLCAGHVALAETTTTAPTTPKQTLSLKEWDRQHGALQTKGVQGSSGVARESSEVENLARRLQARERNDYNSARAMARREGVKGGVSRGAFGLGGGAWSDYTNEANRLLAGESHLRREQSAQATLRAAREQESLLEALRIAKEQTRIEEHARAARALLRATKQGDSVDLQKTILKVRTDYPEAFKSAAFQNDYLELLQLVAPEQVPGLTARFEAVNAEVRASEDKVRRIETEIRAEKSEAELRDLRQRITASEQRALDLEDRLRYDQFERYEQNRVLNSRINNANQRLRDAEWEAAQRSRFPFIQSQP